MKKLGPGSHDEIVNGILPGMDEVDSSYQSNGKVDISTENAQSYLNIENQFHTWKLSIVPRDGVRYWHPDCDDTNLRAPYSKSDKLRYPDKSPYKYKAGYLLN